MHEDAGGHKSVSCHQHGSTVDKSPAVSHTQPVTNTQALPESFIHVCVFIRINLSPCNAFRRSVLAGRLFYLQIRNWKMKHNSVSCFFCVYVVSVCLTLSVCKCVFARLCPVPLSFFSHMGLGLFHQMKKRWLTWDVYCSCIRKMAVFPLYTPTTHMQNYAYILVFYVIAVTIIQQCATVY